MSEELLWILGCLGAVWALGPSLLHLLGLSWIRYVAQGDPLSVEPPAGDLDYQRRFQELVELGFQPVGTVTEYLWFSQVHWFQIYPVRCLARGDGHCYASLYRLDPGEPLRLSLETFTSGGGLVRTVTPGADLQDITDTALRVEVPHARVPELLDRHQEHVQLFTEQRGLKAIPVTLQERAALDEEHDRRLLKKIDSSTPNTWPWNFFVISTILGVLLLPRYFPDLPVNLLFPGALCVASLFYLAFMKAIFPAVFRQECLRSHGIKKGSDFD